MNPLSPIGLRLLLLLPLLVVGLLLPWYAQTRRGILFGVTVPIDFPQSPSARAAIRRYRLHIFLLVAVVVSLSAILSWTIPFTRALPSLIPAIGTLAELIAAYLLWRRESRAIQPHAATIPLERIADLTAPSTLGPILASALALLPLAAATLWLHLHWSQIPARWPQHWSATGVPNGWGTLSTVFHPLYAGASTVVFVTAFSIFLTRASGPQPASRRRALVPLAALAWLIAGVFSVVGLLPLIHLSATQLTLLAVLYIAAVLAISAWLILRSHLTLTASATLPYDSTPDSHWRGGILYYNRSDAAVLVPKRFGLGWTFNLARPASWICLGAILLFVLVSVVLIK